jgi:triacylglycerol lipase
MSTARPPQAQGPSPDPGLPRTRTSQLRIADVLASSRRLWLRGRVLDGDAPVSENDRVRRWWNRSAPSPRPAHLESQVSGSLLKAEVLVQPDSRFEALLSADLPPARRGWRVARNRLTCQGVTAECCAVVVVPPADAVGVVVVLLPLACTFPEGGAASLSALDSATQLAPLLHHLGQVPEGHRPIYYLAAVPADAEGRPRELALAVASLGWPAGHLVPMPAEAADAAALAEGLDRLRWLFACTLDLLALNLEPTAATRLRACLEPADDRARVLRLASPQDDAWSALAGQPLEQGRQLARGPRPSRSGRVTRYPLVFCHGMLAFSTIRMQLPDNLNSFTALRRPLRERGFRALFPQVAPTSGIVARASQLREQILRWTDEPVNVIAHSMGGMDARYLITHLDMGDRVRSLTTIATPHRGTLIADWFIATYRNRVPLLLAMEAFGINVDGFGDCRPAACKDFNTRSPDVPGVKYFSYGGAVPQSRVSPILRRPWTLLTPVEGPNDGLVSVASAHWGEYLGTVEADHFAQTPDAAFVRPGEDFDAVGFCLRLVEDLAFRGF